MQKMKHAGQDALDSLEPVLARLRALDGLKEKTRGVFYRDSRAFLHFHEDPAGLFADVRLGDHFERLPVNKRGEIDGLIRAVRRALASG